MKNLISISGRIGSEKDTIGLIIQYLTMPELYRKNNSFSSFQSDYNEEYNCTNPVFKIKKMAGKLKEIAAILTNTPIEYFEDQEFKKTVLGPEWRYFDETGSSCEMTVRDFLQKLGTEAMRNGLHEDTWINAFWVDYHGKPVYYMCDKCKNEDIKLIQIPNRFKHLGDLDDEYVCGNCKGSESESDITKVISNKYSNWIITDCRFQNEFDSIKERGGLMIKVERSGIKTQSHASETGLDHITDWDYVIQNDGSVENLIEKVKAILIKEKII